MDSVVGIDLSGVSRATRGQTALAQITIEDRPRLLDHSLVRRGERRADAFLVGWISDRSPRVIAIDAPLTLPHSISCELAVCTRCRPGQAEYLTRDVDRLVAGMSTAQLAPITFRGMYLARVLRRLGMNVIETYPAATLANLGLDRQMRRDALAVDTCLATLVRDYVAVTMDERHAVVAGLAAVAFARGLGMLRGDADGEIWLAPGGSPP